MARTMDNGASRDHDIAGRRRLHHEHARYLITGTTWTQVGKPLSRLPAPTELRSKTVLQPIEGSGAYALFDDVSLQAGGGNTIYLQCSDETVLEMFMRCAEVSGENFILSPDGRKVLWLQDDETDCGVRAVSGVDPIEVEGERHRSRSSRPR